MRNTLIEKLIYICKDYRHIKFDKDHVETWLGQFDENDQEFLLEQLVNILKKTYISEKNVDDFICLIVRRIKKIKNYDKIYWGILKNNTHGESQIELNEKLLEALQNEKIECDIANVEDYKNDKFDRYLYIDDIIYTGNTFKYAFEDFEFKENKELTGFVIILYTQAEKYLESTPEEPFFKGECVFKRNNILGKEDYAILHPLNKYLENGEKGGRKYPIKSDFLFNKEEDRIRFENIFYNYGREILKEIEESAENIKPLGYSVISYLGFGNMYILYRNISNNSPLALWYGNGNEYLNGNPSGNVLGRFYPLFPRKTN